MPQSRLALASRRGFTLIEVLVAVGIIVLLTALAIPAILHARNTGIRTRVQSDLSLIDTALAAYKSDFGDYPRFIDPNTMAGESGATQQWLDWNQPRGAVLLCEALIGPGPANSAGTYGAYTPGDDGADGPGFRVRRNFVGGTSAIAGKVYGPYVDPSKFKISFLAVNSTYPNAYPVMLDVIGNPILYYPATPNSPQIIAPNSYVAAVPPGNYTAGQQMPLYNAFDNENNGLSSSSPQYQNFLSPAQLQYILGDRNNDGAIGKYSNASGVSVQEQPATVQPYILWSAGLSGIFGFGVDSSGAPKVPAAGMKTDNITNFDLPADLKK